MTSKIAALFPGQGSQHVGMASRFMEMEATKNLFTQANDLLNFDIAALMKEGDENILRETQNAQPALLLSGVAAWTAWQEENNADISAFSGHSLGEYTALVAAGVISFEDGLKLVRQRGELMAAAMPDGQGGMSAVLGLDMSKIVPLASDFGVFVANDNADGQVILSGDKQKLETVAPALKEAGAKRVLPLPVAGAFHTPLMQSAAEKMEQVLENIEFLEPAAPVILNVTAEATFDSALIKSNLPIQITSPVRWRETMAQLGEMGITHTYEFGAGNVLTNLLKRSGIEGLTAEAVS